MPKALMKNTTRRVKEIMGPLISISVFVYFMYHLIQGERGILSWMSLGKEVNKNHEIAQKLEKEKEALARKVSLLTPSSLDKDLLEERVYDVLNFIRKDEIVIYTDS